MRVRRARAGLLLGLATAGYVAIAWQLPPGFYDGAAPCPSTVSDGAYRWVSPPPRYQKGNRQPGSSRDRLSVVGGRVDPGASVAGPADGQIRLLYTQNSFVLRDDTLITIATDPVASGFPDTSAIHLSSNVYRVSVDGTNGDLSNVYVQLYYQFDLTPQPSVVYRSSGASDDWQALPSTIGPDCSISAPIKSGGYFALGYSAPGSGASGPKVGGQLLPIVTAAAILLVILAGLPLAILRRRRDPEEDSG